MDQRTDTERLDWIESHYADLSNILNGWAITHVTSDWTEHRFDGLTVRAAIDAAIEAEKRG